MKRALRVALELLLANTLIVGVGLAQKPPTPPPGPGTPPSGPGSSTRPSSSPTNAEPSDPSSDYVMYVEGQVATDDGTNLPNNVVVERVCNATIRQQVYAGPDGEFTMQLGSVNDTAVDASADGATQQTMPNQFTDTGIPRRLLEDCEVRASVGGFDSPTINLVGLDPSDKMLRVGTIRVRRRAKIEGATLNAAAYKGATKEAAIVAYQKGLDAAQGGKLASAQKHFEKAIEIQPTYAHAWFQLGSVLERQKEKENARTAYQRAATLDEKYLAPHLALASMAYEERNWKDVLSFTSPMLALDPYKAMTALTMELEPFNYAETYYYNAVANFALNQLEEAEKSALKAEQLFARNPQLHLLLGNIFERKSNYASAISEMRTYLDLAPHAENAELIRGRVAALQAKAGGEGVARPK